MDVINKTTAIIYGLPAPDMPKPFQFKPGKNDVSESYMKFLCEHRNFKRDILTPGLIVPAEQPEHPTERLTPGLVAPAPTPQPDDDDE